MRRPVASQLNVTEGVIRSLTVEMLFIAALGDFFKFYFHAAPEPEGVKRLQLGGKPLFGVLGDVGGVDESLIRGLGAVVVLDGF